MSKLYISEHAEIGEAQTGGSAQVAVVPPIAVQVVDFTAGAASSAAFNAKTRFVRLHADAICSIRFDGVATTAYPRMAADQTEYFGVESSIQVSAIANT